MESSIIPEIFENRIRLSIVTALISGEKDFACLKELTGATDGNLSCHLKKLEQVEYLAVTKLFIGKKPKSTYTLTNLGKLELLKYVDGLYNLVHPNKNI